MHPGQALAVPQPHTRGECVFGIVADTRVWRPALVLVQQLIEVNSTLPTVVFNTTALPPSAVDSMRALGARVFSLEPAVPVPVEFVHALRHANGGRGSFLKLGLWAQTQFAKIIVLDVDVVLLANVDEMRGFPGDTFAPETCSARCDQGSITAGINCGVMVIRPSVERYDHMCEYIHKRAHTLRSFKSARARAVKTRWLLESAEQSLINAFWAEELNASLKRAVPQRRGWAWERVSYVETSVCAHRERVMPGSRCSPGTVNMMSRVYNSRPMDCHRCPSTHRPKIVHFACTKKPWVWSEDRWRGCAARTSGADPRPVYCANCSVDLALRWYAVQKRAWSRLKTHLQPASA